MAVHLTDSAITKARREAWAAGKRTDLIDKWEPGLRLRLSPPSRKSLKGCMGWQLVCRDGNGTVRRFPLGSYPDIGISAARDAAVALRSQVRLHGADPVGQRRRDRKLTRDAKAGVGTLSALFDAYEAPALPGTEKCGPGAKLKSWKAGRRRIAVVFRALLGKPLLQLSLDDFQAEALGYAFPLSASFAVRSLRPVLKWATRRGYTKIDSGALHQPATVPRRDRVLSRDELAKVLPAVEASGRPHAAALRFMLLTLARRDEVVSACWGAVDWKAGTWTIAKTKNGQPHIVPLPHQALSLLRAQKPKDEDGKVIEPAPADLVFAASTGGRLGNWDRETKALMKASGTAGWTRHDLRRTGATMLGDMGELPDIIEAALNHVAIRSPLAATYNRSRYRPQVATALQRLADALDGIAAQGATVTRLKHSAA